MSQSEVSEYVDVLNANGASSVVLVCEHASHFIPPEYNNLGVPADQRKSHVVWDPGAIGVARHLSETLDAPLIAGGVSRLVYDCNRPPDAPDAMPTRSETVDVSGNAGLSDSEKERRTKIYYDPFHAALAAQIARTDDPILVTIHSFTPIYHGKPRSVEIGVLHDSDSRFADAMLSCAAAHTRANVERNQPYGAQHGVTHTLKEHALSHGHLNVMLEVRNDLIRSETTQTEIGEMLAKWLQDSFTRTQASGVVKCAP